MRGGIRRLGLLPPVGLCLHRQPCSLSSVARWRSDYYHSTSGGGGGADPSMPPPPRPRAYTPPEQRDPNDESVLFLKGVSPQTTSTSTLTSATRLGANQLAAPQHRPALKPPPVYLDDDAARLRSTSVHAGQPLQHHHHPSAAGVVGAEWYAAAPEERSRISSEGEAEAEAGVVGPPSAEARRLLELQMDVKRLEYYQGSPQYEEILQDFRRKYGSGSSNNNSSDRSSIGGEGEEGEGNSSGSTTSSSSSPPQQVTHAYTPAELALGLKSEPIDFHRSSGALRARLASSPQGYHPTTLMEQYGAMRFQGYAFPPSVELGKLTHKPLDTQALLQEARRRHESGLAASARRKWLALLGRKDPTDAYIADVHAAPLTDTHILYRTIGLDAVQRRQMRLMLTDFDYADRNTAFHVLMTYPYSDWLHAFYMVLCGWLLYELQVRYGAYAFYDEYLGLDLRQTPQLQKPFLLTITVCVMVCFLFTPLLIGSIATTRAYRILMRRPIGPP